jgi:hypothetical protein
MRIHSDGRVSVNAVATFDAGTTMVVGGGSATVRATSAQLSVARTTVSTHYEGINLNSGPSRACFIGRPPNSDDLILGWDAGSALVEGLRFPSPGGGIKFPATQVASADANTLDDYEEGTFTPVITGTTVAGTATYSSQSGSYIKIGRYVYLEMFVVFASTHTGTGGTKVGGLPFTISGFGNGGTITYKTSWVTNGPDFMQGEATTNFGYLRYDTNTSQADLAPNVNIQNTSGFMLIVSYLTAT